MDTARTTRVLVVAYNDNRYEGVIKPLQKIQFVESRAVIKSKSYLIFWANLAITALRFNPDIIIVIEADLIGFSVILLNKLMLGIPVIERSGGDSITPRLNLFKKFESMRTFSLSKETLRYWKYKILHLSNLYTYNNCSHFMVNSNYFADQLRKLINLNNRRIFIVPQCCFARNDGNRRLSSEKGVFRLLTVTNLENKSKYEGVKELIQFLDRYVNQYYRKGPKLVLTISGGGYFLNHLLNGVRAGNRENNQLPIRCLGYVDNLDPIYRDTDLFVYSSYQDSLPRVLLEAQAYGLPILVNNFQAFHECITDYWNAVFYKTGEFEDFRVKLDELITNENLRKHISTNATKNITENYSPETIAVRLEKVINEVLQNFTKSFTPIRDIP